MRATMLSRGVVEAKLSHPASGGGTIPGAGREDRSAEPAEGTVLGDPTAPGLVRSLSAVSSAVSPTAIRDPISLFGAAGSASGTEEVRRVQDWVASHFAGLVDEKQELIAAGACGDLAYTVAFEHKTVDTLCGERATYTLRTTHVFRREDGEWRIVHRHGDCPPERDDFPIAPAPGTA